MAKVHIMCGKIASGKTTYAKIISEDKKAVILSVDDLMQKLYDKCPGEKQHTDSEKRVLDYFYELAADIVSKNVDAIIDFGFWKRSERSKAKEYFAGKGIKTLLYYVKVPEKTRLSQFGQRSGISNAMDESFREKLDAKFEEPGKDEIDVLVEP